MLGVYDFLSIVAICLAITASVSDYARYKYRKED
mgnify:CR=1 FL=1